MFEFTLPSMSCGHCVQTVKQAILAADRSAQIDVDLATKRVTVETRLSREAVADRLSEAGHAEAGHAPK